MDIEATHLDKVEVDRTELVVTRQSRAAVVVLPLAEWEGMLETLHHLSTPASAEHLRESITQLNSGRALSASRARSEAHVFGARMERLSVLARSG